MSELEELKYLNELEELRDKVKELEADKVKIASLLVNTTLSNIRLMDMYIPEWRLEAKDNIEELKFLLNS